MKKIIFHPFLFALYTVLALAANNIDRVLLPDTYRVVLFLLLGVGLFFGLTWLATRSRYRAGLVSTLAVLLFSSFAHVYNLLQKVTSPGSILGQANVLAALWAAAFILAGWALIRLLKKPAPPNEILNIISAILIVFPILQIGAFLVHPGSSAQPGKTVAAQGVSVKAGQPLPDVYYIILDEYGREDVLKEVMNYDNSEFISYLKNKGFYVAGQGATNYGITLMSIASSLNSTYLDGYVSPKPGDERINTQQIISMVNRSKARSAFEQAGYRFVSFATGYLFTEIRDADLYYQPDNYINDFEMEYINTTVLSLGSGAIYGPRTRGLTLNTLRKLAELPTIAPDRPKFVFAHILAAHVPFVFGPNGEAVEPWTFSVAASTPGRTYKTAYKDQVTYINKQIEATIDAILAKSKVKPVIILQGDHGPETLLDWYSIDKTCLKERMTILNAYYLPGIDPQKLYPTITPVNTFRLIEDTYLGMHEGLLEDHSYFSTWDKSYQYIDVTSRLDTCK